MDVNIGFIFWIAIVFIVVFFIYLAVRNQSRFQKLVAGLNEQGIQTKWNAGSTFMGNFKGRDFSFSYSPGMNAMYSSTPSNINVEILSKNHPSASVIEVFSVQRKNLTDKIGETLGVWHKAETGREEFDSKYFVSTHYEAASTAYLSKPVHQNQINRIFDLFPCHQLSFGQDSVSAIFGDWETIKISKDILSLCTPEFVKNILNEMIKLVEFSDENAEKQLDS